MKRAILLMAVCMTLFACGNSTAKRKETSEKSSGKDRVEVLYFHGKQRCPTCLAIEKNAQEAVEAAFAAELKNGTVVFRKIDLSDPGNEALADSYEVTWSSLYVTGWRDGAEERENLTEFAFAHARTAPETFREGVVAKVKERLK